MTRLLPSRRSRVGAGMNRSVRGGKRFDRSNGLDTALYKTHTFYLFILFYYFYFALGSNLTLLTAEALTALPFPQLHRQLQSCSPLMHGRVPPNQNPGYAGVSIIMATGRCLHVTHTSILLHVFRHLIGPTRLFLVRC